MYLNLIQLAESFGVSEKVVDGWIRGEGLPHTPARGVLLFDRAQVAQWAATRGLAAKAGFLADEKPALAAVLQLCPLLRVGGIWRDVAAADLLDVFARVASALPGVTPPIRGMLAQRFRAKTGVTMAPIGGGYALPHPATRVTLGRDSGSMALILLRDPLPPQDLRVDEAPITRLLFFIAPSPRAHLDMIGRISRLLSARTLRDALDQGATDEVIHQIIADADVAAAQAKKPEVKGS
jgi:PTS system nitrogen regulatory IIA component